MKLPKNKSKVFWYCLFRYKLLQKIQKQAMNDTLKRKTRLCIACFATSHCKKSQKKQASNGTLNKARLCTGIACFSYKLWKTQTPVSNDTLKIKENPRHYIACFAERKIGYPT